MDARHVLDRTARGPDLVLRYDDHRDAIVDVFLPRRATGEDPPRAAGPTPLPAVDSQGSDRSPQPGVSRLAMFLHGGYWRTEWDRVHARPLASGLAEAGYVVAVPEYRRGPASWPGMSADVGRSLAAVRDLMNAAEPGLVEPHAPLILAGHSAGGHLALWAGLPAAPGLVGHIVALAPVSDIGYAARAGLDDNAAQALLGGEPGDVPDAYADADVLRLLPGSVPVTVIHGDEDRQVPVEMNRRLAARLSAEPSPAPFRYVELPGADHFDLIDPESAAWPTVLGAVRGP